MPTPALARRHLSLLTMAATLLLPLPCRAADLPTFDIAPPWVRPGGPEATVKVHLHSQIATSSTVFLRLTGGAPPGQPQVAAIDLPLASDQMLRGLAETTFPTLRRGQYSAQLIDGNGKILATSSSSVKVGAQHKPSIGSILPSVVYPSERGYDFTIMGDNLGQFSAEEVSVRVNGNEIQFAKTINDRKGDMTAQDCGNAWPCLIKNWRTLDIYGLPVKAQPFRRPLAITVGGDQLLSEPQTLTLSCVPRFVPILVSCAALAISIFLVSVLCAPLIRRYRSHGHHYSTLAFLLLDPQTKTYSLSKLQLNLWLAASIMAYAYLAACQFLVQWRWVLPNVPDGLPTLLGLSATTSALAVGTTGLRGSKGAGPVLPEPGDFLTTGGVFAPERLQFFLWTLLGAAGFVAATLAQDPATATAMAEIPDNFAPLMGASSIGYLAGKFARKPGPVIKSITPEPPYSADSAMPADGIHIVGDHLARAARVLLHGVQLSADEVRPGHQQPHDGEFVSELIVTPKAIPPPTAGIASIKVINPDGQCAER